MASTIRLALPPPVGTLALHRGARYACVGASGSGKSWFLNQLETAASAAGLRVAHLRQDGRGAHGVLDETADDPDLTAGELVMSKENPASEVTTTEALRKWMGFPRDCLLYTSPSPRD